MDVKEAYILPYNFAKKIIDADIDITRSDKLQEAELLNNRYFIQFYEQTRPQIKDALEELSKELSMPAAALTYIQKELPETEISFLGVAEEDTKLIYKLYFGFVSVMEPSNSQHAFSIEWVAGEENYVLKDYKRDAKIDNRYALAQLREVLLLDQNHDTENVNAQLYKYCLEIISKTDYRKNFLSVQQLQSARSSVYFSLVETDKPILFLEEKSTLLNICRILQISEEDANAWLNQFTDSTVLEHIGIGCNKQGQPFITFYRQDEKNAPVYSYSPATKDDNTTNQNKQISTNHKHMETNENLLSPAGDLMSSPVPAIPATDDITNVKPVVAVNESIQPSDCACGGNGVPIYALGSIGFDIASQSLKDVLSSQLGDLSPATVLKALSSMGSDGIPGSSNNPNGNVQQLYYAQSLTWLLKVDEQPIYAIKPSGPFARETYSLLRDFMSYQLSGNNSSLMRCSLPGRLSGSVQLNGQSLPVINPEIMGMHCWSINELMADLLGNAPDTKDKNKQQDYENLHAGVVNFLERVYYSLRNKGQSAGERAINFAATNAFQVGQVFKNSLQQGLALKSIQAAPSAFGRPGADCQDVIMIFFNPNKVFEQARTVYRFTVDVTEPMPVLVGPMRYWME